LYPQKRTFVGMSAMSALCQKRTFHPYSITLLSRAPGTDPIAKTNSISRLAMRHGLGCSAVNCIVAHQYNPTFLMIPAYCRRKTKAMLPPIIRFIQQWTRYGRVVQELSRLSERELADIGIARCDIDRIARGQFHQ